MLETNLRHSKAFSLLELLLVLAVVSILFAFALPSYQDFRIRNRLDEATQQFARDIEFQKTTSKRLNSFQELKLDRQNPQHYYLNNTLKALPAGIQAVPVGASISIPFYPPHGTTNAPERSFRIEWANNPSKYYRFVRIIGVTGKVIIKYE
ncbi:MAG: prepilin-type N-terminal cleavage/methylation domain-containing protein [Deinococcales bacterium]